jgi:hypothetical protein
MKIAALDSSGVEWKKMNITIWPNNNRPAKVPLPMEFPWENKVIFSCRCAAHAIVRAASSNDDWQVNNQGDRRLGASWFIEDSPKKFRFQRSIQHDERGIFI